MWSLTSTALPPRAEDPWASGQRVFAVVRAESDDARASDRHRLSGIVRAVGDAHVVDWETRASAAPLELAVPGLYREHKGATLTAKAFDRVLPGMGLWIVPAVAWLFAFSTIISWSYYGEQGVVYLFGRRGVTPYRVAYCLLVLVAASPLIETEAELDAFSSLGTGLMLFANIPIMLLFGREAMSAYHGYMRRLERGDFGPGQKQELP